MNKWAYVEDGIIKETMLTLPTNWRNISNFFALEDDENSLRHLGWTKIVDETPTYDPQTHMQGETTYALVDGKVIGTAQIIPLTESTTGSWLEPAPQEDYLDFASKKAIFMTLLRAERDARIARSDWTQLSDIQQIRSTTWKAAWAKYRQDLRDLPQVHQLSELTNIDGVLWPIEPQAANMSDPSEPGGALGSLLDDLLNGTTTDPTVSTTDGQVDPLADTSINAIDTPTLDQPADTGDGSSNTIV